MPKGCLPIIGHCWELRNFSTLEHTKYYNLNFEKLGDTFLIWMMWNPFLITKDVNLCKIVMTNHRFNSKGKSYEVLHEWLGTGLLSANGSKHKHHRRMLTPTFHFNTLAESIDFINEKSLSLVCLIKNKSYKPFDFLQLATLFQLEMICRFAMGVDLDLLAKQSVNSQCEITDGELFAKSNEIIGELLGLRSMKPYLWSKSIYKLTKNGKEFYKNLAFFNNFVKSVIEERLEIHKNNDIGNPKIFIDIMLKAYQDNEITLDEILEEVNTFLFAGHDTTSTSLSWTLYELGNNIEVQNKLFNELSHLAKQGFSTEKIIKEAKYLDCVIKESLRLRPPAYGISRLLDSNDFIVNGVNIPGKTEINIKILEIQRNEKNWPNAMKFSPERFLDIDDSDNIFKYLPFSAGSRNCIGKRFAIMELKFIIFHIIMNFHVKTVKDVEVCHNILYSSSNGFWFDFKSRNA